MNPILNTAFKAARKAGRIIVHALDNLEKISIFEKNHNDFVTEIDKQSEQEIIKIIHKAYPDHAILCEESGRSGDNDYTWIIDPLDGTTNFIHGYPHFSISIAMQYKNKIEYGLVYDPVRQEVFTATRGGGAYCNNKRIRVSKRNSIDSSLIGTAFAQNQDDYVKNYIKILPILLPITAALRRSGSSALDLAYVAAGRLDGIFEFNLSIWDMAAGIVLVKEAGGLVSDFNGGEEYLQKGTIVAGTPKIYKSLLQIINKEN